MLPTAATAGGGHGSVLDAAYLLSGVQFFDAD
jgi:hypothetical protein